MKTNDLMPAVCGILISDKYPKEMTAVEISDALVEMGINASIRDVSESIMRDPLKRVCKWSFFSPKKKYFLNPFPSQRKSYSRNK